MNRTADHGKDIAQRKKVYFDKHCLKDKLRSYLNEKVEAPVLKTEINGRGDPLD
jgi:hypothetical protein